MVRYRIRWYWRWSSSPSKRAMWQGRELSRVIAKNIKEGKAYPPKQQERNMRRIPVVRNADHKHQVGWLILDDAISDEEVVNCSVIWAVQDINRGLFEVALDPKPRVLIQNDPPELFKR